MFFLPLVFSSETLFLRIRKARKDALKKEK